MYTFKVVHCYFLYLYAYVFFVFCCRFNFKKEWLKTQRYTAIIKINKWSLYYIFIFIRQIKKASCCLSIPRHYSPSSVLNWPHVPTVIKFLAKSRWKLFIGSETLSRNLYKSTCTRNPHVLRNAFLRKFCLAQVLFSSIRCKTWKPCASFLYDPCY